MHIPFFMQDGWPLCDFQEYIYVPKTHWYYTEEQIKEFESGKEKWPCGGLQDLVANVAFWLEGVSFQRSWATVGIVATLSVSFG